MKTLLATLVGSFALATALPTFAGPDWQLIAKARKARQVMPAESTGVGSSGTSAATGCRVEPLAMQLDHGPRAQTTPSQNRARQARDAAQAKVCAEITK